MKTLKKTLAILLFIFAVSCSKDNDVSPAPEPVVEQPISLLTKTIDSDGLILTYTYDNIKRLINYKRNSTPNNSARDYNFSYNTDGTLAQITNVPDGLIVSRYLYDTDKKIIKKEGRNGIDVHDYTYSGNQVTDKYSFNGVSTWIEIYTFDFSGNLSELKSYNQITAANPNGNLSGTFIYTYDNKKNASLSLPKEYLFPKATVNNVATEKYNSNPIYTYNYEYNEKGYPSKRITSYTRSYEYQ